MSRVSVIIPNYNRATLIGETIKNLLAQTCPPHEIIVVDDGSTDESVEVIRSFGDKIKLLQQANQGPGAARNAGLKMAEGDYIQFQDSDDLLSLNKLEAQAKQLDESGADIVFGPWAHVFIQQNQVKFESCVLQQALPSGRISMAAWLLRGWSTVFQSLLFRREFLISAGSYATNMRYGEDMEFFFRILSRGPRVAMAGDTLTLYRVDAPNKLSHDAGLAKHRRDVDWAKCMQSMAAHIRLSTVKIDGMSGWIFRSLIRKHLRYIRNASQAADPVIELLSAEIKKFPDTSLAFMELAQRVLERIRLTRSGYRWMPGYQAASPTAQQIKLIEDLGLKVSPSTP